MLHTRLWIIILSTALLATPAVAAGDQADTGEDCFAVAAPMADATPCFVPGRHKKHHKPRPKHASHAAGGRVLQTGDSTKRTTQGS